MAVISSSLTVSPHCSLSPQLLAVHVAMTTVRSAQDGGIENDGPHLWSFSCNLANRKCEGARVDLVYSGAMQLPFGSVHPITDMVVKSLAGRVAVVTWGMHQFVVDLDAGTVTRTASAERTGDERGVARCRR